MALTNSQPGSLPLSVIKHLAKESSFKGERGLFSSQFQATVHHCKEVKAAGA